MTLTGTNFTGATGVTIGGVACTNLVVVSSTSITCVAPAGTVGSKSVVVTNSSGSNGSNSLWIYLPTTPTDVYIYLKGGRGDGFVKQWTGVFADETKTEKSDPFRNASQTIVNGAVYPGLLTSFVVPFASDSITSAGGNFTGTPNDIAGNTAPRQFDKSVTWRRFVAANGMEFPYRLDIIDGIGTEPRGGF